MNSQKPRVLVVTPNISLFGGIANFYKTVNLKRFDNIEYFELYVTLQKKPDTINLARHGGADQSVLTSIIQVFKRYVSFFKTIVNYDIVHINPSFGPKSFYRDMVFILLSKIRKKKTIVFWHGWDNKYEKRVSNNPLLRNLFRKSFGNVSGYVVLGKIFKNKLQTIGVKSEKFHFITPAIPKNNIGFKLEEKYRNIKIINILYLSRIIKEKGIFIVVKAFEKLIQMQSSFDLQLFIAGEGPDMKEVQKYIDQRKIKNIKVYGKVDNEFKHELYAKSHIFFLPTYYSEGLPAVVLECMYYGMSIVSRENAAISDWVLNEVNGYLSASKDPDEYVSIISKLFDDPTLIYRFAMNNHSKAEKHFLDDKVAEKLVRIYNDL